MSRADYWICPVCDQKALYDGSEEQQPDVIVVHAACYPLIARQVRQATLDEASQTLTDWAAECGTDPARRMRRLTIEACARKIQPRLTDAEAAAAFVDVLTGQAPGFVCDLDETGAIARRAEDGDRTATT